MAAKSPKCSTCEDENAAPVTVQCGHPLCDSCFDSAMDVKSVCSVCKTDCKVRTGDMPPGVMTTQVSDASLPVYEGFGTICIRYHFVGGVQSAEQPSPGERYDGKDFDAYLPDTPEGRKVLALLKVAWERKLTFRLATSCWLLYSGITTTTVRYNIGHKKRRDGGVKKNGYPDPNYLQRCQEELATLGITEKDLKVTWNTQ